MASVPEEESRGTVLSLVPHSRGKKRKTGAARDDSSVLGMHVDRTNSKFSGQTCFGLLLALQGIE